MITARTNIRIQSSRGSAWRERDVAIKRFKAAIHHDRLVRPTHQRREHDGQKDDRQCQLSHLPHHNQLSIGRASERNSLAGRQTVSHFGLRRRM